jgi:chemotaxis protein CheX
LASPDPLQENRTAQQHRSSAIDANANPKEEWIRQMDSAVAEVFHSMLAQDCAAVDGGCPTCVDISASITFSGAFAAQCALEFPASSARRLTCAFLGPGAGWDDTMIADAVGELCNMIAGGWKTRLGASAWQADLSVPLIQRPVKLAAHPASPPVPGSAPADCNQPQSGATCLHRTYAFDQYPFVVCLIIL